ncbi:unnamed protein product, partial [Ectocarpus sp. 4 AP-2014]
LFRSTHTHPAGHANDATSLITLSRLTGRTSSVAVHNQTCSSSLCVACVCCTSFSLLATRVYSGRSDRPLFFVCRPFFLSPSGLSLEHNRHAHPCATLSLASSQTSIQH